MYSNTVTKFHFRLNGSTVVFTSAHTTVSHHIITIQLSRIWHAPPHWRRFSLAFLLMHLSSTTLAGRAVIKQNTIGCFKKRGRSYTMSHTLFVFWLRLHQTSNRNAHFKALVGTPNIYTYISIFRGIIPTFNHNTWKHLLFWPVFCKTNKQTNKQSKSS